MLQARRADLQGNLDDALTAYYNAMTQMGSLDQTTVKESLKRYSEDLKSRQPPVSRDILSAIELLGRHYDTLTTNRVLNRETLIRDLNSVTLAE